MGDNDDQLTYLNNVDACSLIVSTDCSADESEAQATSTSYSFRTNFRPNTDPDRVFTPPQPQAADKKPLSALSVSEAQELKNALLESIAKCMQIQNSLYKLMLLKLQAFIRGQADADTDHRGESNGDTGDSQNTGPRALLNELNEPLNSLMRCADIQRSLYQRLVTVSLISSEETEQLITGNWHSFDNPSRHKFLTWSKTFKRCMNNAIQRINLYSLYSTLQLSNNRGLAAYTLAKL